MINYSREQLLDMIDQLLCKCKTAVIALILKQLLSENSVLFPIGSRMTINKHPQNSNKYILEKNDFVQGYASNTKFVYGIYRGGETTDWTNYEILNSYDNILIQ